MPPEISPDGVLDATGLSCPLPILRAHKCLRDMQPGQTLLLLATDTASWEEVPLFCTQSGHALVDRHRDESTKMMRFLLEAR